MNILFIVPYTPNLIRTRPYNFLRTLANRGHSITLLTLWETQSERENLQDLIAQNIRVIAAPLERGRVLLNLIQATLMGWPLQARYCWEPELASQIDCLLSQDPRGWDVVHVEHLRGAAYGLAVKSKLRRLGGKIPIIWDSVDNISLLFELASHASRSQFGRWVTRFELPRTRRFERRLMEQFDKVLVTSANDQKAFQKLALVENQASHVIVIPNGVDLDYFTPGKEPRATDKIIFSGKLSYHANITAALFLVKEIMPLIWEKRPDVRLQLVGKDPAPVLQACALEDRRIEVTGTVEDLRPYLQQATLAIAPLTYGAGIQNKVLEAMACGAPVVASRQAISALEVTPEKDLLVADEPAELANAALRLLSDPDLQRRLAENGRAYVIHHHDWNRVAEQLEQVYRQAIEIYDGQRAKAQ